MSSRCQRPGNWCRGRRSLPSDRRAVWSRLVLSWCGGERGELPEELAVPLCDIVGTVNLYKVRVKAQVL